MPKPRTFQWFLWIFMPNILKFTKKLLFKGVKIHKISVFPLFRHKTTIRGKNISRDIVHRPDVSAIIAYKNKKIPVVFNRFLVWPREFEFRRAHKYS